MHAGETSKPPRGGEGLRPERLGHRLTPVNLLPLRRAEQLTEFFLYWLPVSAFPIPREQQAWLDSFLKRLSDLLQKQFPLRSEVFLQFHTLYPSLVDCFVENADELIPLLGFGRRPGHDLPPIPTLEDLQPLIERKKKFALRDYVGDFCYWFLGKDEERERELFLGHGGLTIVFMPPDPKTAPAKLPISQRLREHPTFRDLFMKIDPDKMVNRGKSLSDGWLKKSMEIYSSDLPKSPQMKGIQFVVPLLKASDFLNEPQEREKLSRLCDFYIRESVEDGGILFASSKNHQDSLIEILEEMRQLNMKYPER